MAASIQVKRGVTAKVAAYTPLAGELVLDTTTNKIYAGDGTTAGGNQIVASKKGINDATNAAAGELGEFLSIESGTSTALTAATTANVATLTLTPGDWDVGGYVRFLPDAGITITGFVTGPTMTNAGTPAPINRTYLPISFAAGVGPMLPLGRNRFNVSVSTTIYLTVNATFGGTGACNVQGALNARRIR